MKKSVCIEMIYTEVDFYDRFQLAAKDGFEFVEFWSWDDKDISKIRDIVKSEGLKVSAFSGDKSYNLVDKSEQSLYVDFIRKSISAAEFLGCRVLVIHSNALGENGKVLNSFADVSYSERLSNMESTLKELRKVVDGKDIMLVLEPLNILVDHVGNTLYNSQDTVGLLKSIDSEKIKMLYDIYHMQINEGNLISNIKANIDWIGYIHVADVPGRHEPGTGEINYKNVAKTLNSIPYNGIVGFELSPKENTKAAIDAIKRF